MPRDNRSPPHGAPRLEERSKRVTAATSCACSTKRVTTMMGVPQILGDTRTDDARAADDERGGVTRHAVARPRRTDVRPQVGTTSRALLPQRLRRGARALTTGRSVDRSSRGEVARSVETTVPESPTTRRTTLKFSAIRRLPLPPHRTTPWCASPRSAQGARPITFAASKA